jgi:hypothetical protein
MLAGAAIGTLLLRLGLALPLVVSGACVLATTAAYGAAPTSTRAVAERAEGMTK